MLGPLLLLGVGFTPSALSAAPGYGPRAALAAGVVLLMAVWWLTEAVPIWFTACVPLVLFPLLGVFGKGPVGDTVATITPYGDAYILMFLGGMAIGAAMEEWGLHRRVALHVLRALGTRADRLLFGMLVATALVSMWISNTATAVMMLPIAIALQKQLEVGSGGARRPGFGSALMLAVAYASNVGGIGTKIGTGTNSIFVGFAAKKLGRDLGFLEFMAVAAPFVILFLPVVWWVLWQVARADAPATDRGRAVIDGELAAIGPLRGHEARVAAVFAGTAALWILGDVLRPPVATWVRAAFGLDLLGKHYEAAVAMLAAVVLLAVGGVSPNGLRRLPYSTLLLLGGSFAMAAGIEQSGLSTWLGARVAGLSALPLVAQLALANVAAIALSAVASNTATVNVLLGVLPPTPSLLFSTCIASSCDFMLPAGTPPNAIVFGSGYVRLATMMRVGFVLDVLAAVVLTAWMYLVGRHLY